MPENKGVTPGGNTKTGACRVPERQLNGAVIEKRKRNVMTQLRTLRALIVCVCLRACNKTGAMTA